MSGNENGGCCGGVCSCCLNCIRGIPGKIRNFPFLQCCFAFLDLTFNHIFRTAIIIASIVTIATFFSIKSNGAEISYALLMYTISVLICAILTFIQPKGRFNKKYKRAYRQETRQRNLGRPAAPRNRQGGPRDCQGAPRGRQDARAPRRRIQHEPEGAEHLLEEVPNNPVEQIQDAAPEDRNVQEAPFDFHHAEESTSSDEPLLQAGPSGMCSNVLQSSTDPSTQSSRCTPSEVSSDELPENEPSRQAGPSGLSSSLLQSSSDPSTQSTRCAPSEVSSDELPESEPSKQAGPSVLGCNFPQPSTDQSGQSTGCTPKDVSSDKLTENEPSEQSGPSGLSSNLAQSSTIPSTQSACHRPLDEPLSVELHKNEPSMKAASSDSENSLP